MNFGLKRLNLEKNIPVSKKILAEIFEETGFDQNNLSIRETNRLATIISK